MRFVRVTIVLICLGLLASACGSRRDEAAFVDALGDPNFEGFEAGVGDAGGRASGSADGSGDELVAGDLGGVEGSGDAVAAAGGDAAAGATGAAGAAAPAGAAGAAAEKNAASDVGVTATSIKVGNIVSRGGPLGPNQFTPSFYGANAFFEQLNARGGVNGRKIEFVTCDDREEGGQNRECAQKFINSGVFAFVANNSRVHFGAKQIDAAGVPDVGGFPVGYEYFKYRHLFPFYAATMGHYPRNGTTGWDGKLYSADGPYKWMVQDQGVKNVAVLYYSIPISKSEGLNMARGAASYGAKVTEFEINPALPGWDSIVATMRSENVQGILNSIDNVGNQNLCTALDRAGYQVKIHMLTVAGWTKAVGKDYSSPCRNNVYSFGFSLPASVTSNPEVARFKDVTKRLYGDNFVGAGHQWAFEGWLAAKQFTDAVASMGANVTRKGLMAWYSGLRDYDMGGLVVKGDFVPFRPAPNAAVTDCFSVVRWSDEAKDFRQVQPPGHCVPAKWAQFDPVYEP